MSSTITRLAGPIYSARFPNLPVVTTNHNAFTRTYNALYGAVIPRVALVAISQSHADSTHLPVDAVVHHGVNIDDFPVGKGDGGYVALLSRMAANKGVHRAIAIARAAGMCLKIAAKMREPHERAYFEEFVEPHLGDDVIYLGEVDADGKRELLASAAALLNPISWREPFGMAMLESLACGTPVVGCPEGAAPEIVEHGVTGYLGDTDAELVAGLRSIDRIDRSHLPGTRSPSVLGRADGRRIRARLRADHQAVPRITSITRVRLTITRPTTSSSTRQPTTPETSGIAADGSAMIRAGGFS